MKSVIIKDVVPESAKTITIDIDEPLQQEGIGPHQPKARSSRSRKVKKARSKTEEELRKEQLKVYNEVYPEYHRCWTDEYFVLY